jgi:hypothetical protein
MSTEKMFEQASRQKLRFSTTKGVLSTEDLWDLSLESLDALAKGVNKDVKEQSEESFIKKASTVSKDLQFRLDILKHIIEVKLAEKDEAKVKADKRARLERLKEVAARKQETALEARDLADIEKEIAELEA